MTRLQGDPENNGKMTLGTYVYGVAAIAAGIINLVWGEFESGHQPIQAFGDNVPGREVFAYITAVWLIVAGAAILWRRSARAWRGGARHRLFHLCDLLAASILNGAAGAWFSYLRLLWRDGWGWAASHPGGRGSGRLGVADNGRFVMAAESGPHRSLDIWILHD